MKERKQLVLEAMIVGAILGWMLAFASQQVIRAIAEIFK